MNSSDMPRDLFGEDQLTPAQVEELKTKLAWTINNRQHAETALSTLAPPLKAEIKGFRKMADTLARCIRDKSRLPLIQEYGESKYEQELESVRACHLGDFG